MSEGSGHITVLLEEAVDALSIRPQGKYLDGTFGRGGHSARILEQLSEGGCLVAIDRDHSAEQEALRRFGQDARFRFCRSGFADMKQCAQALNLDTFDGVLLDLGVSSPQLDEPARGFSFQAEGPLDMRMDQRDGMTAAEWINAAPEQEIADVFWRYGEERYSRRLARAIIRERQEQPFETTSRLAEVISAAHPRWEKGRHPATRAFQAIRIHVNRELEQVEQGLQAAFDLLAPGGRLVVISFHSLEDRLVKRFMKQCASLPELPRGVPVQDSGETPPARIVARKVRPGAAEVQRNPRARSAVLRALEKVA